MIFAITHSLRTFIQLPQLLWIPRMSRAVMKQFENWIMSQYRLNSADVIVAYFLASMKFRFIKSSPICIALQTLILALTHCGDRVRPVYVTGMTTIINDSESGHRTIIWLSCLFVFRKIFLCIFSVRLNGDYKLYYSWIAFNSLDSFLVEKIYQEMKISSKRLLQLWWLLENFLRSPFHVIFVIIGKNWCFQ